MSAPVIELAPYRAARAAKVVPLRVGMMVGRRVRIVDTGQIGIVLSAEPGCVWLRLEGTALQQRMPLTMVEPVAGGAA